MAIKLSHGTIKVLLVDDHGLWREGLKRIIAQLDDIEVIGEAHSGEEAIKKSRELKPHVVIMDVQMPGIGGLEAASRLSRADPDLKILVLTAFEKEPFPSRMMKAGCSGYLTKGCSPEEMAKAIRVVCTGQRYISPDIAQKLAMKHMGKAHASSTLFDKLSTREVQVMEMITKGVKPQDIAKQLCLSPKTINSYRYRLFEKLGIESDVELTHLAILYGVVDLGLDISERHVDDAVSDANASGNE